MSSLQGNGNNSVLANTNINFLGSAYNAQNAANQLSQLSGGKQNGVSLENNKYDFVGSIIGGNPATNYTIPSGSNILYEWFNMMGGTETVHNCYGTGHGSCGTKYGPSNTIIIKGRK